MGKKQKKVLSTTPTKQPEDETKQVESKKKKKVVQCESGNDSEFHEETSKEAPETLSLDKTNKKRENEGDTSTTDIKRAKTEIETSSTKLFQRIWSEEDEIAFLQGMINYENDFEKKAYENVSHFYDFVKSSLAEVKNLSQIFSKIKSLKNKFLTRMAKGGDETSFTKSHDEKCWELSKKIWETDDSIEKSFRRKTQVKESVDEWFKNTELVNEYVSGGFSTEKAVRRDWEKFPLKVKKKIQERGKLAEAKARECTNEKTGFFHCVSSASTKLK